MFHPQDGTESDDRGTQRLNQLEEFRNDVNVVTRVRLENTPKVLGLCIEASESRDFWQLKQKLAGDGNGDGDGDGDDDDEEGGGGGGGGGGQGGRGGRGRRRRRRPAGLFASLLPPLAADTHFVFSPCAAFYVQCNVHFSFSTSSFLNRMGPHWRVEDAL